MPGPVTRTRWSYPAYSANDPQAAQRLAVPLKRALDGKLNCTGSFTLTASATQTTVTHATCAAESVVLPMAKSATAAQSDIERIVAGNGSFLVTHNNDAATDRTFAYVVFG